ncbi:hypothetical protein NDU88_009512 [Pleurodeles waltl]|uniref:Uncharacterized protein n=1 Tax=Pleurodeles waltl TaxID=8319 RepID=A0AAV7RXS7_PLEWA|nr:hypothetical protein NDU88_009512 [Pleurodeles waltl]
MDPRGTVGRNRKMRLSGIQIPVVHKRDVEAQEEDAETQEEDAETQEEERDEVGGLRERTYVGRDKKAESEDGVLGTRREEEPHAEWSYREQLTPKGSPEEGKRNPGTPRDCHVPGGAWLQQDLQESGESLVEMETVQQGAPMEEATRNLNAKLKNHPRKRNAPVSKDGPPIKKGLSSRKTQESSHMSFGDACHQTKQRLSSLKGEQQELTNNYDEAEAEDLTAISIHQ